MSDNIFEPEWLRENADVFKSKLVAPGTYDNYYAVKHQDEDMVSIFHETVGSMGDNGNVKGPTIVSERFLKALSKEIDE